MAKVTYFGKYRAKVQKVNDPEKRGRIRVLCPKVLGESVSNWCEPCIPVAYNFGGDFAIPKVGETVWIEFEAGDVNKPIYTGGWWSTESTPSKSYNVKHRYIEWNGCTIEMWGSDDKSGEEATIKLTVGDTKLFITDGNIKLSTGRVDLNGNSVLVNGVSVATKGDLNILEEELKRYCDENSKE